VITAFATVDRSESLKGRRLRLYHEADRPRLPRPHGDKALQQQLLLQGKTQKLKGHGERAVGVGRDHRGVP